MDGPGAKGLRMLRLLLLVLLTLTLAAEEPPVLLKGQFRGKVRDKTFDEAFEARLEPGENRDIRVELEGIDLNLGVAPKWHYTTGSTPDGILLNFYVKCRAEEPKLRLQRNALVLAEPGHKGSVELHEKDAENLFTIEFEADKAPANP
jgi:hypothetical protein